MPTGQAGAGQDTRVGEAALPHLDPPVTGVDVHLPPVQCVRVGAGLGPPRAPGEQRAGEHARHLVQIGVAEGPAGDAPQVELVRRAGMEAVDGVPAEHDPRADEEHVVDRVEGEGAQGGGDHGARVAAQHPVGVDVPRVAPQLLP